MNLNDQLNLTLSTFDLTSLIDDSVFDMRNCIQLIGIELMETYKTCVTEEFYTIFSTI